MMSSSSSHLRVALVLIQTTFNELASTPPNPSPEKGRYHTDTLYIFRIAPLILRIQQLIIRLLTLFEVLFYLVSLPPFQSAISSSASSVFIPQLVVTPLFLMGVQLVVSGAVARLSAFRSLGPLFTFDLTIHPAHRLITTGLYSWVRHPAYTGSLAIVAGLGCSHLSGGSLLASLPSLAGWGSWVELSLGVFGAIWWLWTLGIGLSRVEAEDKQMQLLFTGEWDVYAERVRWWFIPGLV